MRNQSLVSLLSFGPLAASTGCIALSGLLTTSSCNSRSLSEVDPPVPAGGECSNGAWSRNWTKHPAVVSLLGSTMKPITGSPATRAGAHRALYALGDVHGDFRDAATLLARADLVRFERNTPSPMGFEWTGADAVFVQVGDLINKGDDSIDAITFARELERKAKEAGGDAIFLAGNHEIGFLAAPFDPKFAPLSIEISRRGLSLCDDVYSVRSSPGTWLRERPAAALVDGVFLSHSGFNASANLEGIASSYRHFVDTNDWDSPFTCGDHNANPPTAGFFNANTWWGDAGDGLEKLRAELGAKQVVFGHDPNAFGVRGKVAGYFGEGGGALVKIDAGMWLGDSAGVLLACRSWRDEGGCAQFEILENTTKNESAGFIPLEVRRGAPPVPSKTKPARPAC